MGGQTRKPRQRGRRSEDFDVKPCWLYVRVFSGVRGTNDAAREPACSPLLSDRDAKVGITISLGAREAKYASDGGTMAFCAKFPTRALARMVESGLVHEFRNARSTSICGKHREYLDMHAVARTLGGSFVAGDATSRMAVAQSLMQHALDLLERSYPGTALLSDASLVPWVVAAPPSRVNEIRTNLVRSPNAPGLLPRPAQAKLSRRARAVSDGYVMLAPRDAPDAHSSSTSDTTSETRSSKVWTGSAIRDSEVAMTTPEWRIAKRKAFTLVELKAQLASFVAFTNAQPRPSLYKPERLSWQLLVLGQEVLEIALRPRTITVLGRTGCVTVDNADRIVAGVSALLSGFEPDDLPRRPPSCCGTNAATAPRSSGSCACCCAPFRSR